MLYALVDYRKAIVKYQNIRKGCKGAGLINLDGCHSWLQNLSCKDHPLVEHVILFLLLNDAYCIVHHQPYDIKTEKRSRQNWDRERYFQSTTSK